MITTTIDNGRLGNQIIRNLAVSLIAEKYDLKVNYYNKDIINKLGIDLFSGNKSYQSINVLNDENYFAVYNCGNLNYNLNPNDSYFQTKDISTFIYNYLHMDIIKSSIIEKNPFKTRYNTNNDICIHIRLTDAAGWNPGVNYYLNTIKSINFDNLYITTDDKHHYIIKTIIGIYPKANVIEYDEITTFQFASTCKHIILSHGSFSAIIGYLSFFSKVYYPEYEHPGYIDHSKKIWYGDMFTINDWIKMSV